LVTLISGAPATWLWACLTGGSLGLLGLVVINWQRRAAQRGSRGASQDLL
jgi:hypothetical protein